MVLNEQGNPDTSWWNNNGSVPSYIDFTNPDATAWYTSNIQKLIDTYDFDTIKFDAGESSWSPQVRHATSENSNFKNKLTKLRSMYDFFPIKALT